MSFPSAHAPSTANDSDGDAVRFLLSLGRALHAYGTGAPKLEEALTVCSRPLGLEGQFFSTPTAIFASFGEPQEMRTVLTRVEPGDVDLEKLARLDEVIGEVGRGELDARGGERRLEEIVHAPPRFGSSLVITSFAIASSCATRFFGGTWMECAVTLCLGAVTGSIAVALTRFPEGMRIFDPLAAFIVSFLSLLAASVIEGVSSEKITLGSLIVLVPGLTLTVAVSELAARHLVSGTARLLQALMVFVSIGFGVAIGRVLGGVFPLSVTVAQAPTMPQWSEWLALLLAPLSFSVLFRAQPRDFPVILFVGVLGFAGVRLGARVLGPELGAFVGAFVVGSASNLYARIGLGPATVPRLPGILLLVPGSFGFRSVSALLQQDVMGGVNAGFKMALIAVAIVAGLLVANLALSTRRKIFHGIL